ncbi:MAG: DUF3105 domain-containing protein [Propionibacteriales bacterium]|nr:DUF3105 domain-containing protein [Propionibacteriales bacterium]
MANPHRRKPGRSDDGSPKADTSQETFAEYDHEEAPARSEPTRRATKRSARALTTGATESGRAKGGKGKKFVPSDPTESGGTSRRRQMADLQHKQQRSDRRRKFGVIGLCVALALAVLAWPTYKFVQTTIVQATPRHELGAPAAEAGCLPEETSPATGNQQHVPDGDIVPYPRLPPDSGPHYNEWSEFSEKFYTGKDRPPIEKLVHNLEHGYVVIWYADTMDEPQRLQLQTLVNTYSLNNPSDKVKAAPWSVGTDGGSFPDGSQLIMTRWVADPAEPTNEAKQSGVRMACHTVSGEALEQFKEKYPATSAPEPNGG